MPLEEDEPPKQVENINSFTAGAEAPALPGERKPPDATVGFGGTLFPILPEVMISLKRCNATGPILHGHRAVGLLGFVKPGAN